MLLGQIGQKKITGCAANLFLHTKAVPLVMFCECSFQTGNMSSGFKPGFKLSGVKFREVYGGIKGFSSSLFQPHLFSLNLLRNNN